MRTFSSSSAMNHLTTDGWLDLNFTDVYGNNSEDVFVNKYPKLQTAYNILLPGILFVIMLAMGCGITLDEVKKHVRKPIGPLIGLSCQFLLMPALSFGLAHALQLESHHAIGMIIIGSCPGGAISNLCTFWSRGDLSLSVCMTMLSTILALGFMPLNMLIYLRWWTDVSTSIPFAKMAISIVLTWIPVIIGMCIQHKFPKTARIFVKVGSGFGIVLVAVSAVIQNKLYPDFFFILSWKVYLGSILLPACGFILGFIIASIACLPLRLRRTVGYETGFQNVPLAFSLISLSYPLQHALKLSQFPLMFGAGQIAFGCIVVIAHLVYFKIIERRNEKYAHVPHEDCKEIVADEPV